MQLDTLRQAVRGWLFYGADSAVARDLPRCSHSVIRASVIRASVAAAGMFCAECCVEHTPLPTIRADRSAEALSPPCGLKCNYTRSQVFSFATGFDLYKITLCYLLLSHNLVWSNLHFNMLSIYTDGYTQKQLSFSTVS